MAFRDDRRGAALQVGAVLLLGFLVIGLSLYQATVVPEENKRVEFSHSQAVQNDLLDLRNALLRAGTSESVQPVSVDMGTTYPSRVLFVNPSPPGGLLRNGTARNVTISNVSATNSETRDFLNGSRDYTTKNLSYQPGYNVYRSAPTTTFQSGVTVNEFEDANDTAITGQTLVEGNRIYLVAVAGNVSQAQVRSLAVDPRSLSTSTAATTVRNTSGDALTLTVPTTLTVDRWRTLLAAETDPSPSPTDNDSRYVAAVGPGPRPNTVNVTFERGKTYRLRTALVGVGTGGSAPGPAYLTTVETQPGDDVTLELRDRFNNPVPNNQVSKNLTVQANDTTLILDTNRSINENGRVGFNYNDSASVSANGTLVNFTVNASGLDVGEKNVTVKIESSDLDGSRTETDAGGGDFNPASSGEIRFLEATPGTGGNKNVATLKFNNTDSTDRTLLEGRVAFYYPDHNNANPDKWKINNGSKYDIGGPLKSVDSVIFDGGTPESETIEIEFSPGNPKVDSDFFILTLRFEYTEGGETRTETNDYFIAVN